MARSSATKRRRLRFFVGFALYGSALWLLWDTPILYPLQVFVVFLHEISHGIAALATGGSIQKITLSPGLGGACYCAGGHAFLTLSAGYLGSLVWGALILEAAHRWGQHAGRIVQGMGAVMVLVTLAFVRGAFGILFGTLFGSALFLAARYLSTGWNRALLTAVGLTSTLYAILDIKSDILDRPHLPSDARMLAELTGVPTLAWGTLWIGIALTTSLLLFLRSLERA
jgi:hypothetical protein